MNSKRINKKFVSFSPRSKIIDQIDEIISLEPLEISSDRNSFNPAMDAANELSPLNQSVVTSNFINRPLPTIPEHSYDYVDISDDSTDRGASSQYAPPVGHRIKAALASLVNRKDYDQLSPNFVLAQVEAWIMQFHNSIAALNAVDIKEALVHLVTRKSFANLTTSFVLAQLELWVSQYHRGSASISGIEKPPVYESFNYQGPRISDETKTMLVKKAKINHFNPETSIAPSPYVGMVIYIGSPVDGEMVIANPSIIDEWLKYIRAASETQVLKKKNGLIQTTQLAQLLNVIELSDGRHKFTIDYDPTEVGNEQQRRLLSYAWKSAKYPCAVKSYKHLP